MADECSANLLEFSLRLLATTATWAAAIVMFFNKQTISIYGVSLDAKYSYSPALTFFVVANGIAGSYAIISLPPFVSNVGKMRSRKLCVLFMDVVVSMVATAGASAATAIAYVARKGNSHAGWMAICDQFGKFCDRGGRALIASYFGVLFLMILTVLSMISLAKHSD